MDNIAAFVSYGWKAEPIFLLFYKDELKCFKYLDPQKTLLEERKRGCSALSAVCSFMKTKLQFKLDHAIFLEAGNRSCEEIHLLGEHCQLGFPFIIPE